MCQRRNLTYIFIQGAVGEVVVLRPLSSALGSSSLDRGRVLRILQLLLIAYYHLYNSDQYRRGSDWLDLEVLRLTVWTLDISKKKDVGS